MSYGPDLNESMERAASLTAKSRAARSRLIWRSGSLPAAKPMRAMLTGSEGRMVVKMDDGTQVEYGPGDAFHMPPGRDAWIVGDKPCVLIDFTGVVKYAKRA